MINTDRVFLKKDFLTDTTDSKMEIWDIFQQLIILKNEIKKPTKEIMKRKSAKNS